MPVELTETGIKFSDLTTQDSVGLLPANNLSDINEASIARNNLDLGDTATVNQGAGNGLDVDLLDGRQGSFYLNYNNLTNKPAPGFRLISRVSVLATSSTGTVTSSVSSATFGGETPDFVMYFASAYEAGMSDLRYYSVNYGNSFSENTLVLGGGSDDTDQGATADIICTSSFVLPYQQNQQFYVRYSAQDSGSPVLRIWAIGFQ